MNSTGATGGLLAPITTEQATMAAKCTGSIPEATMTGRNSGATTTVTDTSSITAPATIRARLTTSSAASGEPTAAWIASVMSCGMRSAARMREIMNENSRIRMIVPVVSAALTTDRPSEPQVNSR